MSSVGVFLGLRCASRARACPGPARTRWLVLAGVAIGGLGIWAMDFIALLGFAVAGETTRYSVPVTLASLLLAVATAAAGLLIAGAGNLAQGGLALGALPLGGLVAGLGVAAVHYLGMAAMRMPGRLSYAPLPFALSVVVAVAAATAVLWGAARLRGAGVRAGLRARARAAAVRDALHRDGGHAGVRGGRPGRAGRGRRRRGHGRGLPAARHPRHRRGRVRDLGGRRPVAHRGRDQL